MFTFVVANSLVFFEVALGQYSSKGFAKVFAMCPIFEGPQKDCLCKVCVTVGFCRY